MFLAREAEFNGLLSKFGEKSLILNQTSGKILLIHYNQ